MSNSNKKLFDKYLQKMNLLTKEKDMGDIFADLLNGKNSYLRMTKKGSSSFDPSWIDHIEDILFDLGDIVNNPREITVDESSVAPIELAKKVNGESVQHLASHSQYIKEINEKGEVIPAKILSHTNTDNIHTYENRFIATFIRRLLIFIEKRYEFIKETMNLDTDEVLMIKNKSIVNGQEVEIETKVTIKKESNDDVTVTAKDYIERIKKMREYVQYYYNSSFMKELKNEKDVRRPILQTNIIRKNPKYHKCYEVFLFIERFDSLGMTYKIDENYQSFNEEERKQLNNLMLSNFLAVQDDEIFESIKRSEKTYKPRFLTSIDDEMFTYGDLLKGPIEFVRIDETYRNFLRSQIKTDLPFHPKQAEKEFYAEEYQYRQDVLKDEIELDRLLKRVRRQIEAFEKEVERLIALREKEEADAIKKRLEQLRREEKALLDWMREKIRKEAYKDRYDLENYLPPDVDEQTEKEEEHIHELYENESSEENNRKYPNIAEEINAFTPVEKEESTEEVLIAPTNEEESLEEPIEDPQEDSIEENSNEDIYLLENEEEEPQQETSEEPLIIQNEEEGEEEVANIEEAPSYSDDENIYFIADDEGYDPNSEYTFIIGDGEDSNEEYYDEDRFYVEEEESKPANRAKPTHDKYGRKLYNFQKLRDGSIKEIKSNKKVYNFQKRKNGTVVSNNSSNQKKNGKEGN